MEYAVISMGAFSSNLLIVARYMTQEQAIQWAEERNRELNNRYFVERMDKLHLYTFADEE